MKQPLPNHTVKRCSLSGGQICDNAQRDRLGAVTYGPRYFEAQPIDDFQAVCAVIPNMQIEDCWDSLHEEHMMELHHPRQESTVSRCENMTNMLTPKKRARADDESEQDDSQSWSSKSSKWRIKRSFSGTD